MDTWVTRGEVGRENEERKERGRRRWTTRARSVAPRRERLLGRIASKTAARDEREVSGGRGKRDRKTRRRRRGGNGRAGGQKVHEKPRETRYSRTDLLRALEGDIPDSCRRAWIILGPLLARGPEKTVTLLIGIKSAGRPGRLLARRRGKSADGGGARVSCDGPCPSSSSAIPFSGRGRKSERTPLTSPRADIAEDVAFDHRRIDAPRSCRKTRATSMNACRDKCR